MNKMAKSTMIPLALLAFASTGVTSARGEYLDLTALTTGTSGTFTGTLGGVTVTGAITANDGSYSFSPTGTSFDNSTTDNTSPQYSYAGIYTPAQALTDRVGYDKFVSAGTATVTIIFSTPVTNPVFQVANLDGSQDTFSLTGGLTGLSLLSGNGGGGDGLGLSGNTVVDLNPNTLVGLPPTTPPPTTGPRSAYGSVQLLGTISTLTFASSTPSNFNQGGDGGSFTLSTSATVPEPSSFVLTLAATACAAPLAIRRLCKRSG